MLAVFPLRVEHVHDCKGTRDKALPAGQALSLISAGYLVRLSCLTSNLLLVGGVQECCSPVTQYATEPGLGAVVTDHHVNVHRVAWLQEKSYDDVFKARSVCCRCAY